MPFLQEGLHKFFSFGTSQYIYTIRYLCPITFEIIFIIINNENTCFGIDFLWREENVQGNELSEVSDLKAI